LGEVERVSDRVAMIKSGRIVFCDTLDAIKESHYRVTLRLESERSDPPPLVGALTWSGAGREWTAVWSGAASQLEAAATMLRAKVVDQTFVSLDDIFLARTYAVAGER
jgi:ABC-type multidrug transport system ATPase subunit